MSTYPGRTTPSIVIDYDIVKLKRSLWSTKGLAQTTEVILDGSDNLVRIENLEVFNELGNAQVYAVDFLFDTANNVYGSNLDFDFNNEENTFAAPGRVLSALNANDPRVRGAGPNGTIQFFIGADREDSLIAAVGGEFTPGTLLWDICNIDCIAGVALLPPNSLYTYADFRPADTSPPDGPVNLSGEVQNAPGTPLCSMVLASGQFKLQAYADGFAPKIQTFDESKRVNDVRMARASECN